MREKRSEGSADPGLKILSGLFEGGFSETCSILCALLDAQLIFREPGLSLEQFSPLWNLYYPDCSLDGRIQLLCSMGLVQTSPESIYTVPSELCLTLAQEMEKFLAKQTIRLPKGDLTIGKLLDDFSSYYWNGPDVDPPAGSKAVEAWGGRGLFSSNRTHYVLIRPHPIRLSAHEEAYLLLLCNLPEAVSKVSAGLFVKSRPMRQRVALFDPEQGHRFNLTRSEVFVHFERFLKRAYGIRLEPDPALTQGLLDVGLLSFGTG